MAGRKVVVNRKEKSEERIIFELSMKEQFYRFAFYFIEFGFALIMAPGLFIVVTIPIIPFLFSNHSIRVFAYISIAIGIAFFIGISVRYFIRKYILIPKGMSFRELLSYIANKEGKRKKAEITIPPKKHPNWYAVLDDLIVRIHKERRKTLERAFPNSTN